tara:strand:+ start:238 stop:492 length:255 start_codon:yes stop_codon:yes gene_type:complete
MDKKIKEIMINTLIKNNWGIYFKGKPLIEMPVHGEPSIYKINDVRLDELEGAISDEINSFIEEINNEGDIECQDETTKGSLDVS